MPCASLGLGDNSEVALLLIGTITGAAGSYINFIYGASKREQDKDEREGHD